MRGAGAGTCHAQHVCAWREDWQAHDGAATLAGSPSAHGAFQGVQWVLSRQPGWIGARHCSKTCSFSQPACVQASSIRTTISDHAAQAARLCMVLSRECRQCSGAGRAQCALHCSKGGCVSYHELCDMRPALLPWQGEHAYVIAHSLVPPWQSSSSTCQTVHLPAGRPKRSISSSRASLTSSSLTDRRQLPATQQLRRTLFSIWLAYLHSGRAGRVSVGSAWVSERTTVTAHEVVSLHMCAAMHKTLSATCRPAEGSAAGTQEHPKAATVLRQAAALK